MHFRYSGRPAYKTGDRRPPLTEAASHPETSVHRDCSPDGFKALRLDRSGLRDCEIAVLVASRPVREIVGTSHRPSFPARPTASSQRHDWDGFKGRSSEWSNALPHLLARNRSQRKVDLTKLISPSGGAPWIRNGAATPTTTDNENLFFRRRHPADVFREARPTFRMNDRASSPTSDG